MNIKPSRFLLLGLKVQNPRHQEISPVLARPHLRHSEGQEEDVAGGGDDGVVHHPTVALLLALLLLLHLGDEDPGHPCLLPHLTAVLAQGAVQHSLTGPPAHTDVGELDLDPLVGGADHLQSEGDVLPPAPPVQEDVPGGGEGELLHGIVAAASLEAPVLRLNLPLPFLLLLLPGTGHELVAERPVEAGHHGAFEDGLGEGEAPASGEITLVTSTHPAVVRLSQIYQFSLLSSQLVEFTQRSYNAGYEDFTNDPHYSNPLSLV